MTDSLGRIQRGERLSAATEFKTGEHWRKPQEFRDRKWLEENYVTTGRSLQHIAEQFGVTDSAIYFWLKKHGVSRNSHARVSKRRGRFGKDNPMYGRTGILNPNWKGGLTPSRQAIYASAEWKRLTRIVRKRDQWCVRCKSAEHLEYHHIIPFRVAPLLALEVSNVCRLCVKCHRGMYGRETRYAAKLQRLIAGKEIPVR